MNAWGEACVEPLIHIELKPLFIEGIEPKKAKSGFVSFPISVV